MGDHTTAAPPNCSCQLLFGNGNFGPNSLKRAVRMFLFPPDTTKCVVVDAKANFPMIENMLNRVPET
eukprot:4255657-Amphidinium_carterae.1